MSKLVGCDFECQRKENINKLRELYERELNNYYNGYNKYLQYKFDKSSERAWKRNFAETTLKPKVEKTNKRLNRILNSLKMNIKKTEKLINVQSRNVDNKTFVIHKKNKQIKQQDNVLSTQGGSVLSRKEQIRFTTERNGYRRMMIIVLILVNLGLVGVLLYLAK
jgi:hypothetical protein